MNIHVSDRCFLSNFADKADEDTTDIVKWMQDKQIYNNTLTVPYPYTLDIATKFLESHKDSKYDFIIRNHVSMLIGCIGLIPNTVQPHIGTLGYWLAKPYWGKGIMTEVVKSFTDFCFKEFGLVRITASCFEHNVGSARVLEKSGFKLEGVMTKHYRKDGQFYNGKLYSKVI